MNAWNPRNISIPQSPISVGASQTSVAISKLFGITAGGSRNIVISIQCSAVTVGAGITAKLLTSVGSLPVQDSKTVAITASGMAYIKLSVQAAGDQSFLPLLSIGSVVVSTGIGSAVTIDDVRVLQED